MHKIDLSRSRAVICFVMSSLFVAETSKLKGCVEDGGLECEMCLVLNYAAEGKTGKAVAQCKYTLLLFNSHIKGFPAGHSDN